MSPLQDLASSPSASQRATSTSTGTAGAATSKSAGQASTPLSPILDALKLFGFAVALFI